MGSDNAKTKSAQWRQISPLALALILLLLFSHMVPDESSSSSSSSFAAINVQGSTSSSSSSAAEMHVQKEFASIPPPTAPCEPCNESPAPPPPAPISGSSSSSSSTKVSKLYQPVVKYDQTSEGPRERFERIRPHAVSMGEEYLKEHKQQEKGLVGMKSGALADIPTTDAKAVVEYVERVGWGNSDVFMTLDQSHAGNCIAYNGNCNLHGENLLGRCFCMPGWGGAHCETETTKVECTHKNDKCFYSPEAGVFAISYARWEMSQEAEKRTWNKISRGQATFDRTDEHLTDFDEYKPVGEIGANLGNFMEVGSGPWTQSYWMMKSRQFKVDRYVLLDPGVISYVGNVESTVFRRGEIPGYEGKTVVINGGGEHLDIFEESFDTVMMVNVLQHVNNAVMLLRNVYNSIKPGGLFIFSDCWMTPEQEMEGPDYRFWLDVVYHPIRMKKAVFEQFLSGFDPIYDLRDLDAFAYMTEGRNKRGTYFVGRKKMC